MAQRLPLKVKDTKGLATVLLRAIEDEPTAEMGWLPRIFYLAPSS